MPIDNPSKFDLYSVYVQTITANEQRRLQASIVYLSIISAGIAILGSKAEIDAAYIVGPIALVSLIWLLTVVYYRDLAKAKFAVVKELENDWVVQPFAAEWAHFKAISNASIIKLGLTRLEMLVPVGIFFISLVYFVVRFGPYLFALF